MYIPSSHCNPAHLRVWKIFSSAPGTVLFFSTTASALQFMPLPGKTTGANLIRILNPQNKLPASFLCEQIIEQRRPQTAQMQKPRWTRSEPRSGGSIVYGGIYSNGVVAAADPCGARGQHSSQEGIHECGGVTGGGVLFPRGDVSWGTFAAVERRDGLGGGGCAGGCESRVVCSTQRRPSAQRLIAGTSTTTTTPIKNPEYSNIPPPSSPSLVSAIRLFPYILLPLFLFPRGQTA